MPKRRSDTISTVANNNGGSVEGNGAIGATGSGMSPGIINNLAERINERLREPVIVQGYSRTRGRMEDISVRYNEDEDNFTVHSDEGGYHTVDINDHSCTCGQYQYRQEYCRHLRAVDEAMGNVRDEVQRISDSDVMRTRISQDAVDELNRNREGTSYDDAFFYTENIDEFDRTFNTIDDSMVVYEYENVLNGNTSTFGVELEFVGGNADSIARELYDLGIVSHPRRLGYHARTEAGKWKLESDSSVSSGSGGGELVSPVLSDTPETWRQIKVICDVAKRHGARVDQHCGGHVHVGMNKLDTARQRWRRFFKTIENYEECIYRASGGDLGRVRSNAEHYATTFSRVASNTKNMRFNLESDEDVREMASRVSGMNRYYGINLKNIATRRAPTVEFRYFNGSLNEKQIQANVKMAAGIINASEKARFRDTDDENYKKRGNILKNATNSIGTRTKEKMMEFLDIAFSRKKDKDAIINVFKKNDWR